jgi:hypothetical protein
MEWMNLHTTKLRSAQYVGCEPVARATWINVLAYCCEQENDGVIAGAARWKDRQWQQACGVTLDEVKTSAPLVTINGDDVEVWGFPHEMLAKVKVRREASADNGKKGGRPVRKPSKNLDETQNKPTRLTENNLDGTQREPTDNLDGTYPETQQEPRITCNGKVIKDNCNGNSNVSSDPFNLSESERADYDGMIGSVSSAPLNLPSRLRESWNEIERASGHAVATKALEAATRIFKAPSDKQLLQTYRAACDAKATDKHPDQWPDFRRVMEHDKLRQRTGTTAEQDDDEIPQPRIIGIIK